MDVKHHAVQILGILTLIVAVVYSFYVLVGFIGESISDIWLMITHLLNVAVAAYLLGRNSHRPLGKRLAQPAERRHQVGKSIARRSLRIQRHQDSATSSRLRRRHRRAPEQSPGTSNRCDRHRRRNSRSGSGDFGIVAGRKVPVTRNNDSADNRSRAR